MCSLFNRSTKAFGSDLIFQQFQDIAASVKNSLPILHTNFALVYYQG